MKMLLDQSINIDLVLCPTLFQVGMKGKRKEEEQLSKRNFRGISLKLLEGLRVTKKINIIAGYSLRILKICSQLSPPLSSPKQKEK